MKFGAIRKFQFMFINRPNIPCSFIECYNNDAKGKCDIFIPTTIKKLKPNNKFCFLYENEEIHKQCLENLKKKPVYDNMTEEELLEMDKDKKKIKKQSKEKANKEKT